MSLASGNVAEDPGRSAALNKCEGSTCIVDALRRNFWSEEGIHKNRNPKEDGILTSDDNEYCVGVAGGCYLLRN